MKKIVNGKVVDIKNIQLFELAAEGLALQNTTVSTTTDGIEATIDSPLVSKYIKEYDIFFRSMPYPLYAIEDDIKYATLGNFIKAISNDRLQMWVDRGLHIKLDPITGMTLKVVNNTWSIVYIKEVKNDNTSLNSFKNSVGYPEFTWTLNKILNHERTNSFYKEFMPEFVDACNNQDMVLKWELENILTFTNIPKKTNFKLNRIIDTQLNEEYSLDIYCTGTASSTEKVGSLSIDSLSLNTFKQIRTYSFDAYSKPMYDSSKSNSKISSKKIVGLQNLFLQLCGIKNAKEMNTFPDFYAIVHDTNLIFTIDKRLFITKINKIAEQKDLAHGVELYTVEGSKIYFTKSKKINNKITKDTLYSYNIPDGVIRMCKIIFTY